MTTYKLAFFILLMVLTGWLQAEISKHSRDVPRDVPKCSCTENNTLEAIHAHMVYFGGPVIGSPHVINVFWNSHVLSTVTTMMNQFIPDMITSRWITGFSEYNTLGQPAPTTNQVIRSGVYLGAVTLTPFNQSQRISDKEIQNELFAQITAGNLPEPTKDEQGYFQTIYMVTFPSNMTLTGNGISCEAYCAYHSDTVYPPTGGRIPYAVLPYCNNCGNESELLNFENSVSHELAEIITDPFYYRDKPGWYDPRTGNEIADVCENLNNAHVVLKGRPYSVAPLWSMQTQSCVPILPRKSS